MYETHVASLHNFSAVFFVSSFDGRAISCKIFALIIEIAIVLGEFDEILGLDAILGK